MQNYMLNRNPLHLTGLEGYTSPTGLPSSMTSSLATAIPLDSSAVVAKCHCVIQRGKINFKFFFFFFFPFVLYSQKALRSHDFWNTLKTSFVMF